MRLCVYGAASPTIDPKYIETVEALGELMVSRGHSLVFGGGGNGLMGAAARGVRAKGGKIFGVIPRFFDDENVEAICDFCDELVFPETMRERKRIMEENADGFIVVPGGIGTFEEFFEILTLKQLCRHQKPIAIYNINGYYDEMLLFMRKAIEQQFLRESCMDLFFVTDNTEDLFSYLEMPAAPQHSVRDLKDG
ncbi:MAG: TIGR00730 family Rossman fold protein [Clostridia bacterium]|nr:TIGR00730 family Rossman fold protein [Clostridia bacterium]